MQSSTQTAPVPQGTAPSTALLRTRALTKEFRGFAAVQGVDLDVAEGSVHALVGPNGAGKTTLFNLLTGFLTPTSGTIHLGDRDITGLSSEQIVHLGVARSFQITSLFDQMSLRRPRRARPRRADRARLPVLAVRRSRCASSADRAMDLLEQVGLADRAGVLAGSLAYGQKRALELALALALDPRLLLLDEPTAGMGVEDVDRTIALVKRVASGPHRRARRPQHARRRLARRPGDRAAVRRRARRGPLRAGAHRRTGHHGLPGHRGWRAPWLSRPTASRCAGCPPGTARRRPCATSTSTVGHGEVVTLVGRNGAGKTTLLRSVMGLHRHCHGPWCSTATTSSRLNPDARARRGLGWVPDDRGIYASLSVEENLLLPPVTRPESAWSLEQVYDEFPVLRERADFPGTRLSGGEQQMLAMARVLRSGATLLLLDEPSEGLAPVIVQRIGEIIRTIKAQGTSVLLVEQNVTFAATVADRHHLLAQGRVVESLDNDEFRARREELLDHLGM